MANVVIKEFKSLSEFNEYLEKTPLNNIFRWKTLESNTYEKGFNQTQNFSEALELLKNGWEDMSKKLTQQIKLKASEIQTKKVNRMSYDVAGFQASVPRYLQGIPTSMINKKQVVQKQKVITIVKHTGYLGNVSAETIVENSLKALQIVKQVEALGYRVNLDVISPANTYSGETAICRVRIKSAAERLNVSKIAFPLVHPDMLRRMVFRFREVNPDLKDTYWAGSYGSTIYDKAKVRGYLRDTDYYLHNFIGDVDSEIKNMNLK
jgi:hypothetical protein